MGKGIGMIIRNPDIREAFRLQAKLRRRPLLSLLLLAWLLSGCAGQTMSEPAAKEPGLAPESANLSEKIKSRGLISNPDNARRIEATGRDLGLKTFLESVEKSVGKVRFRDVYRQWGAPQELEDLGTVVAATWRWSVEVEPEKDQDKGQGQPRPGTGKIKEELILTFDKSDQILIGWRFSRK